MKSKTGPKGDWRKLESIREAILSGVEVGVPDGANAAHRSTLLALTPAERTLLLRVERDAAGAVAYAAGFLVQQAKLQDAIALYDSVVESNTRATEVLSSAGVNASYALLHAPAALKTKERARAYLDYFVGTAASNPGILLNLALLRRDVLDDGRGAIAHLREAIELGDPRIRGQIEEDAGWRALPGYTKLAAVTDRRPSSKRKMGGRRATNYSRSESTTSRRQHQRLVIGPCSRPSGLARRQ